MLLGNEPRAWRRRNLVPNHNSRFPRQRAGRERNVMNVTIRPAVMGKIEIPASGRRRWVKWHPNRIIFAANDRANFPLLRRWCGSDRDRTHGAGRCDGRDESRIHLHVSVSSTPLPSNAERCRRGYESIGRLPGFTCARDGSGSAKRE